MSHNHSRQTSMRTPDSAPSGRPNDFAQPRTPDAQATKDASAEQRTEMAISAFPQNTARGATPALTPETIAKRAYQKFLARGGLHGHDQEDWLAAEQELLREAKRKQSS